MRRWSWAALAALGLVMGAGCREREEGQATAAPSESERAEARQELQTQAGELADAAREWSRHRLHLDTMVDQHLTIYAELLENRCAA